MPAPRQDLTLERRDPPTADEIPAAAGVSGGVHLEAERPAEFAPPSDLDVDARPPPPAMMPGEAANIPWSYGKDRVTAAAIDPNRLYVYWEVTDDGIARARSALPDTGAHAWLNLRVHDTTGLLFDGRNSHHHFDHGLDRGQRQWFFDINRPSSTVFVEMGLRTADGTFSRIARSGRVDFPRDEPAPLSEPEWMTVLVATGEVRPAGRAMPVRAGPASLPAPPATAPDDFTPIPLWVMRGPSPEHEAWIRELAGPGWERVEWREIQGDGWLELIGRAEWEGPRTFSSWEAGPFSYPVEVREPTREEWQGQSVVFRVGGVTRIVHGPWQVVIRNLDAHLSRTVLGRWHVYRSWVAAGGREIRADATPRGAPPPSGASEGLALGASERAWISGSEVRLGGASELWRLGASELRLGGASERLLAGASEWRARGASEQVARGASEWAARGASERRLAGASERRLAGASERRLAGASERRLRAEPDELELAGATPSAYPKRG